MHGGEKANFVESRKLLTWFYDLLVLTSVPFPPKTGAWLIKGLWMIFDLLDGGGVDCEPGNFGLTGTDLS